MLGPCTTQHGTDRMVNLLWRFPQSLEVMSLKRQLYLWAQPLLILLGLGKMQ